MLAPACASPFAGFKHVVVIVQENRTPDSLFYALCTNPGACSTSHGPNQYDIQTSNWLDKEATGGVIQPVAVPLANSYDLGHGHHDFVSMCDAAANTGACLMDGAANIPCTPAPNAPPCPPNPQFAYVDNSDGTLDPYLALATQYGWANYMFETNQGPSFPAHQFIFGGTSAPKAKDDEVGVFASENGKTGFEIGGCAAAPGTTVQLINSRGVENPKMQIFPCFEHRTVSDLLRAGGFSWRYYTSDPNSIWTAPNAIRHICLAKNESCIGPQWTKNVDLTSSDVLSDIAACNLRDVSWVIPTGQNSDHPGGNTGGGPSWVASVVNAIGGSGCADGSRSYWSDTAILVMWDDWGGWYDHEPPAILPAPEGGYQLGFRVPLIVISAYTPAGYIDNGRYDFGSVIRFIEHNFGMPEGSLNFADARADTDLTTFFNFNQRAREFRTVPSLFDANHFLNDTSPPLPPDSD
jgi:phospholipase C